MLTCGVCAPVCCTYVCVHVCVSVFTAKRRHTTACYSKGLWSTGDAHADRQGSGKALQTSPHLCWAFTGIRKPTERRRDFGERKKYLEKKQGGEITQGMCHIHQCADVRGEQEVGSCEVSTWQEAPRTGGRGWLCFQRSLSPCTYKSPESNGAMFRQTLSCFSLTLPLPFSWAHRRHCPVLTRQISVRKLDIF